MSGESAGGGARPTATGETGEPGGIRTVVVRSPSARRETILVLRALFHIVFWSAVLIALERGTVARNAPGGGGATLTGEELFFRDLDPEGQRLFRAIGEGVVEAEAARSRTGEWPSVEELARRGIPPFAVDPIDRAGYRWRLLQEGTTVNYFGLARDPGGPTYAIVVLEPEPDAPIDPRQVTDEIHHRLADGTLLHVSIWTAPGARDASRALSAPPVEEGWRRITALTP